VTYFGKRYLVPALGRWASADPLAVHSPGSADLNLYAYVYGQLLRGTDPDGLDCGVNESCNHPMTSDGNIPAQPEFSGPEVRAATTDIMTKSRGSEPPHDAPVPVPYSFENPVSAAGAEASRIAERDPNPVAKLVGKTASAFAAGATPFGDVVTAALNAPGQLYAAGRNLGRGDQYAVNEAIRQGGSGVLGASAVLTPMLAEAAVAKKADAFVDLAAFRRQLGLPAAGSAADASTVAKLEIGGESFWGINAHGQKLALRSNAISATHAEADAFNQAMKAGVSGGSAVLTVDRALCKACGLNGAVKSFAGQLGLDSLKVQSPKGIEIMWLK
jgi:hypothetical protein